jgi:hypothetical protein
VISPLEWSEREWDVNDRPARDADAEVILMKAEDDFNRKISRSRLATVQRRRVTNLVQNHDVNRSPITDMKVRYLWVHPDRASPSQKGDLGVIFHLGKSKECVNEAPAFIKRRFR